MSRVARKCFFGAHAPDLPACDHLDIETNTSLLILDCESLEICSISAGKFSISVAKKHRL